MKSKESWPSVRLERIAKIGLSLHHCGVLAVTVALLLAATGNVRAQTQVYSEDFDVDHSNDGTWIINSVGGYNPVNLHFDYNSVGIPPAPHSAAGTTLGLKLQANLDPLVQRFPSGSSASPIGLSIPETFEMRWDWWINFNGPLPAGGSGSTQVAGGGFGTAAVGAQAAGAHIDSIYVAATGEPTGSSADYRVYSPRFQGSLQDSSGVYAAGLVGSRNNTHSYYQATFPPVAAPPAQVALYPQQAGWTQGGSAGMAWREVLLKKAGNIVTYSIDGLRIATIDVTTNGTLGGDKIVFGHFDINPTASADPNAPALAFSLVDNVRITVTCPADVTVDNDPGVCGAQVNYTSPGGLQTAGLASGSIFPVGATVNTFQFGEIATCSFTVTVVDNEPPTITAPDITVPATSPAGAPVTFSASAADNCSAELVCEPASGSLFPIGETTVVCLATDAAGNTATSSFTVRVKGAAEQITDLIALVQSLALSPGTANSLLVKLEAAQAALSHGNVNATCGNLKLFVHEVAAQVGKKEITEAQANLLIQEATRIGVVLDCKPFWN